MPWYITGDGCVMHRDCISSSTATPLGGTPTYRNDASCTISIIDTLELTVEYFETELNVDTLTLGGATYSGAIGPKSGRYFGEISWSSDATIARPGWKLCKKPRSRDYYVQ